MFALTFIFISMGILSIIGVIALLFVGKFIWDTFITGKTDKQHEVAKKRNPEEVARMESNVNKGEYLNFDYSPKRNPTHREISLTLLAAKFECLPEKAKEHYQKGALEMIMSSGASNSQVISMISDAIEGIRQSKSQDAVQFSMDPDDTPAALTQEWLTELLGIMKTKQQSLVDDEANRAANRQVSLEAIAEQFKCSVADVEKAYKSFLSDEVFDAERYQQEDSIEFLEKIVRDTTQTKQKQALEFNIHPDDTPASFMAGWAAQALKSEISMRYDC